MELVRRSRPSVCVRIISAMSACGTRRQPPSRPAAVPSIPGNLVPASPTTGPGATHLLNGLYDAKMDSAPVVAITGLTFHDLIGTSFMQDVDTIELMKGVALYNTAVLGFGHAKVVSNIACRSAPGGRGVAHISVRRMCRR